jgi:hypothetical protein
MIKTIYKYSPDEDYVEQIRRSLQSRGISAAFEAVLLIFGLISLVGSMWCYPLFMQGVSEIQDPELDPVQMSISVAFSFGAIVGIIIAFCYRSCVRNYRVYFGRRTEQLMVNYFDIIFRDEQRAPDGATKSVDHSSDTSVDR